MLNLMKASGVYGCWVQYVSRSYCKLLVKSVNGFECCKKIRSDYRGNMVRRM